MFAAENFYGSIAKQIGGKYVNVTSILNNPNADPHLFTTSPEISVAMSKANIIIYNGIDYDTWMNSFLNSQENNQLTIINVGHLMQIPDGANPHIWYQPNTFPTVAKKITQALSKMIHNKQATKYFNQNLNKFLAENKIVQERIKTLRQQYKGTIVTATEPVFGYMATALGLHMKGLSFQWKIMNDAEPTPKMLAQYENLIKDYEVKVLFYNDQVTDPTTKNILKIADQRNIPVVGVSETMPRHDSVNQWLIAELDDTGSALKSVKK